jgi:hypothetical protein
MKKFLQISVAFLILCNAMIAQKNIKSIQLRPLAENNFSNIIPLGTALQLSFDDLEADQKEYFYKIEHMTYDWKPSDLLSNEYISGFHQNPILTVENSFNTLQNYTHYKIQFPNQNLRITKSGNYLLSVLDVYDNVLFTRRFTYYEKKAIVGVNVIRSANVLTSNSQQKVQFSVNYNPNIIRNPGQEIEVAILQNGDWNISKTNIKPQFYKQNQLIYNHVDKTNFWSGNEFLNFDNKQIRNTTIHIAKVEQRQLFHHYLYPQEKRNQKVYTYNPDINGQFIVRTTESNNPSTEADYTIVHFSLPSEKLINKEVYVYGAFNNFETTNENKMVFNPTKKAYQASLLLKQGFYNYTFITKNIGINTHELNGSFQETENEYSVIVYYKAFGQNYYQAIGFGTASTKQ